MIDWRVRLAHDRAVRDALVACGNKPPDRPDSPGGFIPVKALVFSGKKFRASLEAAGHDAAELSVCRCLKG